LFNETEETKEGNTENLKNITRRKKTKGGISRKPFASMYSQEFWGTIKEEIRKGRSGEIRPGRERGEYLSLGTVHLERTPWWRGKKFLRVLHLLGKDDPDTLKEMERGVPRETLMDTWTNLQQQCIGKFKKGWRLSEWRKLEKKEVPGELGRGFSKGGGGSKITREDRSSP